MRLSPQLFRRFKMPDAALTSVSAKHSPERIAELHDNLTDVRSRVQRIVADPSAPTSAQITLVAVSKYKPASDVLACYEAGQKDFGENYVQELVEKAEQLPVDIRWHFIGALQSNKAKILASIPNLYTIQTLTSTKAATALNKNLPTERSSPLNILLQVNTSGEDNKSGLTPLTPTTDLGSSELVQLARHIITDCPRLHLQGLMTIGSLRESLSADEKPNQDFLNLIKTRDLLQEALVKEGFSGKYGENDKLLVSMGMSSDFEAALKVGSDIVRVGTGIFGSRPKKGEVV
ncbi:Pyridoxal phosphate homeostasis protein [Abortiporus biennis]